MSLYLQRLARPALGPVAFAAASALPRVIGAGVQEIEQVTQVGAPLVAAAAQADAGWRAAPQPSASPWTQVPAQMPTHTATGAPTGARIDTPYDSRSSPPCAPPAEFPERLARWLAAPPSSAPATRLFDAAPAAAADASHDTLPPGTSAPAHQAAGPPGPPTAQALRPGDDAQRATPRGSAPAAATVHNRPQLTLASARAAAQRHAARAAPGGRQVEVHIGSIALTVKVPASPVPSPAPAPTSAASPHSTASAAAARAAPADTLRFSPARHHLRWTGP